MFNADRTISDGNRLTISLFDNRNQMPMIEISSPCDPDSKISLDIDSALDLELLDSREINWLISKNDYIKEWMSQCGRPTESYSNWHHENS